MVTSSIETIRPGDFETAKVIGLFRYEFLLFFPAVLVFIIVTNYLLGKKVKSYLLRLLLEVLLTLAFIAGYILLWSFFLGRQI